MTTTNVQRDDGFRPPVRRALRGDGSALANFLCPICYRDVLVEDVACDHLLLVRDRHGEVYCRDRRVRREYRESEAEVGESGARAVERLCERLGPAVILYELVDPPRSAEATTSVVFVVDTNAETNAGRP
jgi:transposase InsO family protein